MGDKTKSVAINLDGILMQLGQFGKFQLFNYMLIIIPVIFAACNNGNYIFSAGDLEYRYVNRSWCGVAPVFVHSSMVLCVHVLQEIVANFPSC